ncbi:carbohydrate kinase family protein [Nonomuraea sp. RK-328]|nr:carbohydrate kinase family protein [Nonomuraea sp. RK-328]
MTVATVGVHIVDILARPVERIPEGQDTVLVDQIRLTAAGAAAGTAVDLVKLGNDVVTMGAIGDDELGDFLLAVLAKRGVDASRLVRKPGEQTAASILPIRPDGGRPSFHVPGANLGVTLADLDVEVLRGARVVHLGGVDVTFGLGDPEFFALLDALREGGTIVTMDLLSELPDLLGMARAFLPHVDYVLPNASQALLMTGLGGGSGDGGHDGLGGHGRDGSDVAEAALALLADGPRGVLVTLGGDGSLVATADGVEHLPALKVEVSDTTGCGDAYCAGFVTGLLHGRDVLEAARWGTAAAARVATGLGSDAGITDLDSTLALLT